MSTPTQSNQPPAAEKPTLGPLALATYRRDLERLMEERPGQWVAYHGDQLVGFAKTDLELYQLCKHRGYQRQDYIVAPIEPEPPSVIYCEAPFFEYYE
ncbi:MAG TPA: DUF5678 domain-containing protein [Gemmataceae bacterium]|nr:DUF5678 domain-containing protein [Gemmataceae bacterium]